MREIDFLPPTYGDDRRQESRVKKQYVVLSLMFLVMIIWNASARRSMNLATAALCTAEDQRIRAERVFMVSDQLSLQAVKMKSLVMSLGQVKDNLNPAVVLAELSVQIPERIVLRRLELATLELAQPLANGQTKPVQVILSGLGADVEDIGKLIERMESSDYFFDVSLTHSQKALDTSHTSERSILGNVWPSGAVDFELTCYLTTRPSVGLLLHRQRGEANASD